MVWQVETHNENETKELAKKLAQKLIGGEVICLMGELGSGKTTFVQGLAEGLGVNEPIISPTFTLVREYFGRLPLFHVDAYRLNGLTVDEVQSQIGLWDYMERGGVVVIEWADLVADALPVERLDITFSHTVNGRLIQFEPHGEVYERLVSALPVKGS
ncbi:MAG: tRNA (adenosine(37)-N6)-threonylcarbamoyltransferase complex ATPase subunit type 1 TsaE [Armatimonadetes bacterium]|nr:tRNA (adenosine(37)-N6)-threonylcarbamoyltransferase complex ATPase subunit type 1 TsaE [Armatimonadota bacterium]MCX7967583.1 tRNA (adenosine(37)-N6)-threonylcarbamoyltransferase complex ATPase subunit type 1 TsaE [Armatimonadota bacterium]MDW8143079.1 tRNA (adenosine(37)-N6)-threonylcarbamoyltransferase complex ATPase subunit type 1 TsaE [Armatimonadota bacterium]